MRIDGRDDLYIGKIHQGTISSQDKVQGASPQQTALPEAKSDAASKEAVAEAVVSTPRKDLSISDIKVSLGNRDSSLVGLGNLGGIQSSVMRKAVSDMQKDSVLHEYQYFVGSGAVKNVVVANDEDGVVIRK